MMLRLGSSGPEVVDLQRSLARLGYKLKGTGYFGGATDTAVTDFQNLSGLEADGVVGPKTAAAIAKACPPSAVPVIEHVERPLWLIEALKWLNLREAPGAADNPKIIQWAREEGGAVARDYRSDSIPWCSLFANMALTKVGLKGTETLWALDFDSDTKWPNAKLAGPAVGAFAPMKREGGGHIAIVVGRTSAGRLLGCVGGNQSDQVSVAAFPPDRPRSFRWPLGVSLPPLVGFNTLPVVNSAGVALSTRES
jgi:uncharacterized protein (TIGR02594 family)